MSQRRERRVPRADRPGAGLASFRACFLVDGTFASKQRWALHVSDLAGEIDAEACELTLRGTPLRATTGRSQASAPLSASSGLAAELAGLVGPQGCAPAQPAAVPPEAPLRWRGGSRRRLGKSPVIRPPSESDVELPPAKSKRESSRRDRFTLRDGLRPINSQRQQGCGRRKISCGPVAINVRRTSTRNGRDACDESGACAYYANVLRCGSVWACPVCGSVIRARAAAEVEVVVDFFGGERCVMLSLTVRHGLGDSLEASKKGLLEAWAKTTEGKPWQRFRENHGVEHTIRALEVTHGPNGWHPHIHALLVLTGDFEDVQRARAWLLKRWQSKVRLVLGAAFVPNSHGVELTPYKRSDYIAKVAAWELTDPAGKKAGHENNRSPSEIARDYVNDGRSRDAALWREYCAAMRGSRLLTWSRGLKELVGVDELSDRDVADAETAADDVQELEIADSAWRSIVEQRGLRARILEVAESAVRMHPGDPSARYRMLQQFIHDELAVPRRERGIRQSAGGVPHANRQPSGPPNAPFREFPF